MKKKHKYVSIYVGSEAPDALMALLLGQKILDSSDQIVEASSMEEACKKLKDDHNEDLNFYKAAKMSAASKLVWWNPEGYEGYMAIRLDLLGSLKKLLD